MNLFRLMKDHRLNVSVWWIMSGLFLLAVLLTGCLATAYLGRMARQEIIRENQTSVLTISTYTSSVLNNLERAVKSLAGSPWIARALISKRDQDIEHANSTLDRYKMV